jgi:hypothetical protein
MVRFAGGRSVAPTTPAQSGGDFGGSKNELLNLHIEIKNFRKIMAEGVALETNSLGGMKRSTG